MESEEFKISLVFILMIALLLSQVACQTLSYQAGLNAGKVSVLAPEKASKE